MTGTSIVTITLNPAFDVHCQVPDFESRRENLVESSIRNIGGKGINITRALIENGIGNRALAVLGEENGDGFLLGMKQCGITDPAIITVAGRIRENITIHPADGRETRISFKGFRADGEVLVRVSRLLDGFRGIVTFTGSVPEGITEEQTEEFLRTLKAGGAKIVIDSKSVPLDMLLRLSPWLIKPNSEEIFAYFGELDLEGTVNAAKELHGKGIDNALISLGADGAVLACGEGVYIARPPRIDAVSTIGAGDSMIAGFVGAADKPAENRLRIAVAYGSAACLTEGTNPPRPGDVERIVGEVKIEKL